MFKLDFDVGCGLTCDPDGVRLGADCLLVRPTDTALQPYQSRSRQDFERLLGAAYGPGLDADRLHKRLVHIAELLGEGRLPLAQICALQLGLPRLSKVGLERLRKADALLKFNPYHRPPGPGGGQFASSDEGGGGATGGSSQPPGQALGDLLDRDLTYDGRGGQIHPADAGASNLRAARRQATAPAVRQSIAFIARTYVNSTKWSDAAALGPFGPGTNKCFLFVASVVAKAGAFVPMHLSGTRLEWVPPSASDWADTSQPWPGWRFLGANETPQAGDVAAQQLGYTDATGHVMIVGLNGTFIGTGNHANGPPGTIEQIPKPTNLGPAIRVIPDHPIIYRRWIGP